MATTKARVLKTYDNLPKELREKIKLTYPEGFSEYLIDFTINGGTFITALPFETEDKIYLIRMSKNTAKDIIKEDDDYNSQGNLKENIKSTYEEKYKDDNEFFRNEDFSDDL